MNAAAAARASIIRTSMVPIPAGLAYSNDVESIQRPPPTQGMQGRDVGPRRRAVENPSDDVSPEERRRVIQVLDYLEYKARCDYERQQQHQQQQPSSGQKSGFYTAGPNDSVDSLNKPPPDVVIEVDASSRGRIVRMFTVFPYRDMSWVVAFGFVLGSIVFMVNAVLGVLPVIDPALAFPTLTTVALPATILLGAVLFLVSGCLGIVSAFNADRGTVEVPIKGAMSGANYRPALIGSESWVWIPSAAIFAKVAQTLPFQAGAFQLTGGMILSVSAFAGLPGLLNPEENLTLFQALVFLPQVIGGSMFTLANVALTMFVQDRWYKPKPSSADWQGGFWNAVGSSGFAITGVLLLLGDSNGAAWTSLYGSAAFLMGSVIQLYALMEFHPTPWAA
ncbi:hypothetical protein PpBr36_02007 [Pyricularia pennisetigena]|uniref:hypothetical protein n=1 Tax=Pyricularia pennisetigena TaxID=1578925 RepID=UPI00114E59F5|nr:hypothetical protein PpBr36_02007 [Pyricularia pennisetigena]TLS27952.1 hypothetical protein PpBr36_02007 [Pyricularia pennisetigena]